MLWTPKNRFYYGLNNWGANPSAGAGVSVGPGVNNAEGSWYTSGLGVLGVDVYAIHIVVHSGNVSLSNRQHLLDIGVDAAGGTNFAPIISNIVCGNAATAIIPGGGHQFFFPIFIKAGSTIGFRIQGSDATAGTVRVALAIWGWPSRPWMEKIAGAYSETIGTITNSSGVSFTPGNTADGSWVSLGTTTLPLWWWNIGYSISNTVITAEYTYIDLGVGDASNKDVIMRVMHLGSTAEACGSMFGGMANFMQGYWEVPAGSNLYIRGRCNGTPDTGYNAVAIGIGG